MRKLGHMSRNCPNPPAAGGQSKNFFSFAVAPVRAFLGLDNQDIALGDSGSAEKGCDKPTQIVNYHMSCYPALFHGLYCTATHALVDTGAQDGCMGLWHFQRWMLCLAELFQLTCIFLPTPDNHQCGGVGGQESSIAAGGGGGTAFILCRF